MEKIFDRVMQRWLQAIVDNRILDIEKLKDIFAHEFMHEAFSGHCGVGKTLERVVMDMAVNTYLKEDKMNNVQEKIGAVVMECIEEIKSALDAACGLFPDYVNVEVTFPRSLIEEDEPLNGFVRYGSVREINVRTGEVESGCEFKQLIVNGKEIGI